MPIPLSEAPTLADLQRYVHDLEALHGWLDTDVIYNCFLMGEEVGELHRAVRDHRTAVKKGGDVEGARDHVGDEIVDVLNYLFAIANRLDIDLEEAFRRKNARNEARSWDE
ncbi:MAG: MazG nucleotide pyrophosphohydrolase domain-containing protein [Myxococcota bacterium]